MTRLVLLPPDQAGEVLMEALGGDPTQVAGLSDLIRDEVTARGACPRAATIQRVCRFVAPAVALDASHVAAVCQRLERDGDIVIGPGGVLYATPLRAVDLGEGALRILSSLSTPRLAPQLSGSWTVAGTTRTCQAKDLDQARAEVLALGGVVISPAEWAGLDRAPPADQGWLDALDRRLAVEPEPPASLERDDPLTWCGCTVAGGAVRWKAGAPESATRLWRSRNRWGHWHYAWTEQGTPSLVPFVALRPDEGARTVFALARARDVPLAISVTRHAQGATLSVPYWLPLAEYRYLAVLAVQSSEDHNGGLWSLPDDPWATVIEALGVRLGLVCHEETGG